MQLKKIYNIIDTRTSGLMDRRQTLRENYIENQESNEHYRIMIKIVSAQIEEAQIIKGLIKKENEL